MVWYNGMRVKIPHGYNRYTKYKPSGEIKNSTRNQSQSRCIYAEGHKVTANGTNITITFSSYEKFRSGTAKSWYLCEDWHRQQQPLAQVNKGFLRKRNFANNTGGGGG
jgi:hypothetical protein